MKDDITRDVESSGETKKAEAFLRMDPIVKDYADVVGDPISADESDVDRVETVLADMLADLMHWADEAGVNFDGALSTASMNYTFETDDEDEDEDDEDALAQIVGD